MYKFITVILTNVTFEYSLFFLTIFVFIGYFYFTYYYNQLTSLLDKNVMVFSGLFNKLKNNIFEYYNVLRSYFFNIGMLFYLLVSFLVLLEKLI